MSETRIRLDRPQNAVARMDESGEIERLKLLLQLRLHESGWKDQLKAHCKEIVQEKGVKNVTVDDLVDGITPKARALVPETVKRELLQKIRSFLDPKSPHAV